MKKSLPAGSQKSWPIYLLFFLVLLGLLAPIVVSKELLYPFVVTRELYFRILIDLGFPLYAYLVISDRRLRPSLKNPLTLSIGIFFAVALVSGFFGVNPMRSFWGNYERMGGSFGLFHLVLLYFYLLLITRSNEFRMQIVLKGIIWLSGAASVYAMLEKLGMPPWVPDESLPQRASSFFGNPIFFASFLILPLCLTCLFFLQADTRKSRWLYGSAVPLQIIAVFLTGTRGAVAGLAVAAGVTFAVYAFGPISNRDRKLAWQAIAAAVVIGIGLFVAGKILPSQSVLHRLVHVSDSNSQSRIIQWKMALRGFPDHPLLGVGPENYYTIANKYFDRTLYAYDYSWFDKPHNYLLEVLVTQGILGFAAYIAVLGFAGWAFYRGYKKGLLGWGEYVVLAAGFIAYQIQNFFVFDTLGAAITFFVFLALAGFLVEPEPAGRSAAVPDLWPLAGAGIAAVAALYAVFALWISTIRITQAINYGYAIDIANPEQSKSFFEEAKAYGFMFDPGELGVKQAEFAVRVAQDSGKKNDAQFVNAAFDDAIATLEQVTEKIPTVPSYWFDLGNMYSQKAYYNKSGYEPKAKIAIDKAVALAPNRIEPLFFLVQIKALQNDIPGVVQLSQQISDMVPGNAEAHWRLALAYKDSGQVDKAVQTAEEAQQMGYKFKLVREFQWLINYYADKQNYPKVVSLYETAVTLSPADYQLYASLATAYAKVGEADKARAAAKKVLELNPGSKASVEVFLNNL